MKKTLIGLVVLLAFVSADILMFVLKPMGANFFIVVDITNIVLAFVAICFGVSAFRLHGYKNLQGKAILFLTIAVLCWFLGEVLWAYYEIILGIKSPMASFADLVWLLGYPLFAIGLYNAWRITEISVARNTKIFAFLVCVAVLGLASVFLGWPTVADQQISLPEKIVSISYVLGDVILIIGCIVVLWSFQGGSLGRPWLIISFSLILSSVADIVYSYLGTAYLAGNWIDLLWHADYAILAYGFFYHRQAFQSGLFIKNKIRQNEQTKL